MNTHSVWNSHRLYNMNRLCYRIVFGLTLLTALIIAGGCDKDREKDDRYDESLLYGKWYSEEVGLFYEFTGTHEGRYFDSEDNGKPFTWNLQENVLQMEVHGDGIDVTAFETFIILTLDTGKMTCYDENDPMKETMTFKICL